MNTDPVEPIAQVDADPMLLRSTAYLLRPLVRFMIANGITYPTLSELLKRVYLRVARDEFSLGTKRLTDSRVSLITGLHRKDVKRLREEPDEAMHSPRMVTWGSRLISLWLALPEYCAASGEPRPLPRLSSQGKEHSFESLAARVTRDIGARGILDELVRNRIARVDADDLVHLEVKAFVPREDSHKRLHYFAANLHDHCTVAVHNMQPQSPPMLERSVDAAELSDEAMLALEKLAEQRGMDALIAVNEAAQALAHPAKAAKSPGGGGRIRFGIYFLRDRNKEAL